MKFSNDSGHLYQCPECKKKIISMYRHDYVDCGCPNHAMIDGGSAYERCGWKNSPPVLIKLNPRIAVRKAAYTTRKALQGFFKD